MEKYIPQALVWLQCGDDNNYKFEQRIQQERERESKWERERKEYNENLRRDRERKTILRKDGFGIVLGREQDNLYTEQMLSGSQCIWRDRSEVTSECSQADGRTPYI